MKNTYLVTVDHVALTWKNVERTFFVEAETKQDAYLKANENLMDCGIDGFEYVVSIEEA